MAAPSFKQSEYQSINPTTGEILETFSETTDANVSTILNTAHRCFTNDWRWRTVAERASIIAKAASLMRERAESLAQCMTLEMGKLSSQARYEVNLSADILSYYATHAEAFLKAKPVPETTNAVLVSEPIGVILAIEPWNFPCYQLARVAGPQLVAGNTLIVKHAPSVPRCALAFSEIFKEAGTPEGAYTNIFCTIPQVNDLIDNFLVRGVTLTGSERAGAAVAERAGRNIKKVVLELGGSDPFIVLEDAVLEDAIERGCTGRMICMGQACVSSKRFIVVGHERGEEFLEGLKKRLGSLIVGDPADPSTSLGPVFSQRALSGLLAQIASAEAHGARIVSGGKQINRPGFYLEPTIITDITINNPLFEAETFGPIVSFYVVNTEQEAIELANATKFGLGASVFGEVKHANEVAMKIESGMVFINSFAQTSPELPFGGVKNSGFGRELSELGIWEFINRKLIKSS